MKKANKYKMRAECQHDLGHFLQAVHVLTFNVTETLCPDVDVEFTSTKSLKEIRDAIRNIVDGHVMLQTVDVASKYTGERKDFTNRINTITHFKTKQ